MFSKGQHICYIILLGKVTPSHNALRHNQNVHHSEYIENSYHYTVARVAQSV
jgi:hypothetical protein